MKLKNQLRLLQALEFANWAHRNQTRKTTRTPYIIHPLHGVMLLIEHGLDPDISEDHMDILVAEACHDTLEDNREEIWPDLLEKRFGAEVSRIVMGVTLDPNNPDKRKSRKKVLASDWKIQLVKVTDVLSNTLSLITSIKENGLTETQQHFREPLSDRLNMERWFVGEISCMNEHMYLVSMLKNTDAALDELESLIIVK